MRRYLIFTLFTFLSISNIEAIDLKPGILMCTNPDSVRKIVQLNSKGDALNFINFIEAMEYKGICKKTKSTITQNDSKRKDLYGGVSQLGNKTFVATVDLR